MCVIGLSVTVDFLL